MSINLRISILRPYSSSNLLTTRARLMILMTTIPHIPRQISMVITVDHHEAGCSARSHIPGRPRYSQPTRPPLGHQMPVIEIKNAFPSHVFHSIPSRLAASYSPRIDLFQYISPSSNKASPIPSEPAYHSTSRDLAARRPRSRSRPRPTTQGSRLH